MNLDVETSSPSAKRSRNPTKSHKGKLQKHGPTEAGDNGEEEGEDDEEEQGGQQNGIGEDTAGGAEDTKRASSLWQASRIYRVSRASGGKDRHSKVLTAKGLRDRRVRLSVSTAIQFYDLQDRLGYDQPSKAVDWLIKAASDAISDLPSLDGALPNPAGLLPGPDTAQHPPSLSAATNLTRSAGSSTSETSRGSLLSLSRSETLIKTREKAGERTKDKEKVVVTDAPDDQQDHQSSQTTRLRQHHHQARNSASSFTELLMDCNNQLLQNQNRGFLYKAQNKFAMVVKKVEPPSLPNLDYFSPNAAAVSGFTSGQAPPTNKMNVMALAPAHFANATQLMGIAPLNALGFADHHPELQQFAFSQQDHHTIPNSNYYNQNFSMSGFSADSNRGTLQSNSVTLSHLHHLQKLSSTLPTGAGAGSAPSGLPFFIGAAPASTGTAEGQYPGSVFDARLQLCYNDGSRQPTDLKGKGKG